MIKGLRAVLAIGSLGVVLGAPAAMASVSFELLGNATTSMATGTPTVTSGFGLPGGGLNIDFGLGSKVAFQIGGHYMTTLRTIEGTNYTSTDISTNAGFKFMFSRAFSLVLGGYYNIPQTNSVDLVYSDYGASAGLGLGIPLGSSVEFYINPTYHYGLNQQNYKSDAAKTLTPSEIVYFVGFVFGGGGSSR